jgi:hypothetical protein
MVRDGHARAWYGMVPCLTAPSRLRLCAASSDKAWAVPRGPRSMRAFDMDIAGSILVLYGLRPLDNRQPVVLR